jgi:hypothetical protein
VVLGFLTQRRVSGIRPDTSGAGAQLGLAALALAGALVLVWGGLPGTSVQRQLVAVLAATLLGACALGWLARHAVLQHCSLVRVLGLALLLRGLALLAGPVLEDDHYRYLWDGLQTLQGLDPYRLPPAAFFDRTDLAPLWQDVLSGINNPHLPTLYGPVLQALFALAQLVTPGQLLGLKLLLLAVDMAVLLVLARLGLGRRWLLVYAVHPLVLREAMASAHPDGLLALLLLLALLAWRRQWPARLGLLLGLAVATKVAALVVLPFVLFAPGVWSALWPTLGRALAWAARVALACAATLLVVYAPFVWVGGSDWASLQTFGQDWRFNPLLFRLLTGLVPAPFDRWAAAALLASALVGLAWHWRTQARRAGAAAQQLPDPPVAAALVALLLLAPVCNPWYWLWVLPLALLAGQRSAQGDVDGGGGVGGGVGPVAVAVATTSVVAVVSYLNTTVLSQAGWAWAVAPGEPPFTVAWPLTVLQLLVLAVLTMATLRPRAPARPGSQGP